MKINVMKAIRLEFIKTGVISLLLAMFTIVAITGISMGQSFEKPVNSVIQKQLR